MEEKGEKGSLLYFLKKGRRKGGKGGGLKGGRGGSGSISDCDISIRELKWYGMSESQKQHSKVK